MGSDERYTAIKHFETKRRGKKKGGGGRGRGVLSDTAREDVN